MGQNRNKIWNIFFPKSLSLRDILHFCYKIIINRSLVPTIEQKFYFVELKSSKLSPFSIFKHKWRETATTK